MSLQKIPHDVMKYRNNPVELLDISKRNRIGSEYALTANTKLLITGAGENNSTTILDSTGKTITRAGDTKISTTQSIIGGSSIYFDGTGDYLSLADSADWDFGSGDFTIDFWVRFTSLPVHTAKAFIYNHRYDGSNLVEVSILNTSGTYYCVLDVYSGGSYTLNVTKQVSLSVDTWYHISLVRNGTSISFFIGGIIAGTSTTTSVTLPNIASTVNIGRWAGDGLYLNGYLSHLRITKGQALWTSNFTPPKYISNNYIGA